MVKDVGLTLGNAKMRDGPQVPLPLARDVRSPPSRAAGLVRLAEMHLCQDLGTVHIPWTHFCFSIDTRPLIALRMSTRDGFARVV